jgi:hypothetical protein
MRTRWLAGRGLRALAALLVMAGILAGAGPGAALASARGHWTRVAVPLPGSVINTLGGVAVVSSRQAWMVGSYSPLTGPGGGTLIERWDGTAWKQQASPNPGGPYGQGSLSAVAATSPANAWAVGVYTTGGPNGFTLIEHWDGTAWTRVPSPSPGVYPGGSFLDGVAATSPANAWAVGSYDTGIYPNDTEKALIEHWDGTAWTRVPSPTPQGFDTVLTGVAATSATNAWAVGSFDAGRTLIEHWNGTAWTRVPSPNPGGPGGHNLNWLYAVAASSPANAWAVGETCSELPPAPVCRTLILRWDGAAWTRVPSPNPSSSSSQLHGVAATSATNAWAVGFSGSGTVKALIEHWDGTAWSRVKSPSFTPRRFGFLSAVSAASPTDIWAVGEYGTTYQIRSLTLHCC